jgi:hypothetical protein
LKCWINAAYPKERLWLHYFWIFVFMFGTVIMYSIIFVFLRARSRKQHLHNPTIHGATPLMILYPAIYVICTSPLAIGRIAALAGANISLEYFCAAGTMIACNGWLDVLLYASTRADIVFSEFPPGEETGIDTFAFMGKARHIGPVTTIEGNANRSISRLGTGRSAGESHENLYGLNQINIKSELTVRSEAKHVRTEERGETTSGNWDLRSVKSANS